MTGRTERVVRRVRAGWMWGAIGLWLAFSLWFFTAGPYAHMAEQGGIPDEEFFQAPADVEQRVGNMTEDVRTDYKVFLGTDFVFIALYGATTFAVMARACVALVRRRWLWHLVWTAPAGAAADVAENVAMFFVLAGASAWPFVVFQSIKAVFTSAAMGLALLGGLALLVHGILHPVRRGK